MSIFTLALVGLFSFCTASAAAANWSISGQIQDSHGQPIPGSSVRLYLDGEVASGMATDDRGQFTLAWRAETLDSSASLHIQAVGYLPQERRISVADLATSIHVSLSPSPVLLDPVQVTRQHSDRLSTTTYKKDAIREDAGRSAIPSNPLAALKAPNMAKVGSAHSSQIRLDGSAPNFTLNGVDIGSDPDHYGMFAIVPAAIVERMTFQPMGTDASFGVPSAVTMATPSRFSRHADHELAISTLDLTGTVSRGNGRMFVLGSVRKSVLDILVKQIDVSSDRRAIPPTNFTDLFLSSGYNAGPHWRFYLDHYVAMDKLSYTGNAPSRGNAIATSQLTNTWYAALRSEGHYRNIALNISSGLSGSHREYVAAPVDPTRTYSLFVTIKERSSTWTQAADLRWGLGALTLRAGHQLEYRVNQTASVAQRNWNFLPPFANTDNPYIYQVAMNEAYGKAALETPHTQNSTFLASALELGRLRIETGLRAEHWSDLAAKNSLLFRQRLTYTMSQNQSVELYAGTFAEHPISNILEPYQAQIRTHRGSLRPITTSLVSAAYRCGPAQFTLYHKRLNDLPLLSPDFALMNAETTISPSALPVTSSGRARFTGANVALDLRSLPQSAFGFYGSYAYTQANKVEHGIELPFDLHSPHRIFLQGLFKPGRRAVMGVDFTVRSGYPYSPTRWVRIGTEARGYNADYFRSELSKENSYRFPTMMMVSFHGSINFGSSSLTASVANITNRANPIIKSASGFIYDVGILPSLGFTWRF